MNLHSRLAAVALAGSLFVAGPALGQPLAEPPPDAAPSPRPVLREVPAQAPVTPRPDPGPSVRERGARTRRANPASGVLLVFVLVGAIGYWVMKRLKRY